MVEIGKIIEGWSSLLSQNSKYCKLLNIKSRLTKGQITFKLEIEKSKSRLG